MPKMLRKIKERINLKKESIFIVNLFNIITMTVLPEETTLISMTVKIPKIKMFIIIIFRTSVLQNFLKSKT